MGPDDFKLFTPKAPLIGEKKASARIKSISLTLSWQWVIKIKWFVETMGGQMEGEQGYLGSLLKR